MKVLVTGATGLIGKSLVKKLQEHGHTVHILSRKKSSNPNFFLWNPEKNFIEDEAFEGIEAIIHLAGASIAKRWTTGYKKELYSSRIESAKLLKSYCEKHQVALQCFISASGINYYGTCTLPEILSEDHEVLKHDFLAKLCQEWEEAAFSFHSIAKRIVCLRTPIVLAKDGGSFLALKKITDFNLASPVGKGTQWMNWIHLEDLVNLYIFVLEHKSMNGSYNALADESITNKEFMRQLATQRKKLFLPIPVPGFLLAVLLGEMSSIILEGSRASNHKIKNEGFLFAYPQIEKALQALN